MSGFRMTITMSEERWQSLTPAERQRLQDIVDGVYEPPLAELGRLVAGTPDEDQTDIVKTDETTLHIPKDEI